MSLVINRDATPVTAITLTENSDSKVLMIKAEHSPASPSLVHVSRELPVGKKTVLRAKMARTKGTVCFAGTPNEIIQNINASITISAPVGAASVDLAIIRADLVGLIESPEFLDLITNGLLPQ